MASFPKLNKRTARTAKRVRSGCKKTDNPGSASPVRHLAVSSVRSNPQPTRRCLPHHLIRQRKHALRLRALSRRASGKSLAAANPGDLALHGDALIAARKVANGERSER